MSNTKVKYARFHEDVTKDIDAARAVFELAVKINFKRVDHLAEVWCQWAEMEIRLQRFDEALKLMGRATAAPRGKGVLLNNIKYTDETLLPQVQNAFDLYLRNVCSSV